MSFINPLYLWALLALAIPIAIHLWSKKEGKTIKIGSIKLLSEEDSKQSSNISINEILLLFLRLLIITLVVIAMAEPQIKRETVNTSLTYIIEPSLIDNDEISSLIDTLKTKSDIKFLQKGFPDLTDDVLETAYFKTPNYWQLAKDMEALRTDSIIVFTNAFAKGLKGKRPIVKKNIEWIILNTETPEEQILKATLKKDDVELISIESDSKKLSFSKENIALTNTKITINNSQDSIKLISNNQEKQYKIETAKPLNVFIYYDETLANEARYLYAAFKAISKHLNRPIEINKTQDLTAIDDSDLEYLIWLSEKTTHSQAERLLLYKPDNLSNSIITKGASKNEFYLTRTLNTENIIEEHLTEQILNWLNLYSEYEGKIKSSDKRVISKAELLPVYNTVKEESSYIKTVSISKWLWLLLSLILVIERIIARIRKQ